MVGTFLASTPLLKEAWRLCIATDKMGCGGFMAKQVRGVGYVAFSGVQELLVPGWDPNFGMLAPLDAAGHGLFAHLTCRYDGEEPVMVHSGVLHLFLHHHHSRLDFQSQIRSLLAETKSIVITGHSIGGSIAFLTGLWLLSYLKSIFSPFSVLCIGFGSPFLGNGSLSRAILRERWGGNFYNVVSTHDIMPRLSLNQSLVQTSVWHFLVRFWHTCKMYLSSMNSANLQLTEEDKARLFSLVVEDMERLAQAGEDSGGRSFWPFGNYLFCSNEGTICLDNAVSVNKMMHLMLRTGSPNCILEEHLKYGQYVERLSRQSLKRSIMERDLSESSYEASLSMALNSSGTYRQVLIAPMAKDCLKMGRRMGRTPNLNAANLAVRLSKITPYKAEIEWYKACCDKSEEQRGYYDSFKQRGASKREFKINMNRFNLAAFWDNVIHMMDRNELPHDFHRCSKWVNASQFYKLLVEPLDIAEYYRLGKHLEKGHYRSNGRERRYEIFDWWWNERVVGEELGNRRTKNASLTQDTCFWARVEEAKEWLDKIKSASDPKELAFLRDRLDEFEAYAMKLVEGKEVSADVLAKNSSFSSWLEEWRALKLNRTGLNRLFQAGSQGD
ncbi:lipase-like PAD4 [Syzygium oleosum]|uniref:lipase-like PAD4 n=1 Tax=Syzygium oleosum TaxID=219896 RepID=UPI0024BBBF50|nr:lipase-like PAD4 [Syzygium oleosum]